MSSRLPEGDDELSLDEFYERAPCGYLSLRHDGLIVRVNATLAAWTGRSREELLGELRFASLLTIGGQLYWETHCAPQLLAGQPLEQVALELRHADGTALPVLLAAKVRPGADAGTPPLFRLTLVDVSQRRAYEQQLVALNEELARSNEEYDTFIHAAAHDLRTAVRGIRQSTEIFLMDTEDALPPGTDEHLQSVVRLSERMGRMLDDLMAYAQAGRDAWHPVPVDLAEAVRTAVELVGPHAVAPHVTSAPGLFTADPGGLAQLLVNLVGNAVKYAGDAPAQIAVGTCSFDEAAARSRPPAGLRRPRGDTPVLTVSDQGIGIEDAYHERIFGLFRQLDPRADGSGTGLALCRMIARRQGGDVWLTSTPGAGSTFYVLLGEG